MKKEERLSIIVCRADGYFTNEIADNLHTCKLA